MLFDNNRRVIRQFFMLLSVVIKILKPIKKKKIKMFEKYKQTFEK